MSAAPPSPALMDALRVVGAGAPLELARVPVPRPGRGEVAVRVAFVGVCGTDLEIARGDMVYYTTGAARYPCTLGHEWSGVVCEVGEDVGDDDGGAAGAGTDGSGGAGAAPPQRGGAAARFAVGDCVVGECSVGCALPSCARCAAGAYHRCAARTETGIMNRDGAAAEVVVLPARALHRVAAHVPLRAAALAEPLAVALNACELARVGAGSVVAVLGDGPIGLLLLLVSKALGAAAVFVVGADDARLALASRLGASGVVDARDGAGDGAGAGAGAGGVPGALLRLAAGRDIGVLLEASGSPDAVHAAVAAAAPGATIVLQGLCGAGVGAPRSLDVDRVVVHDLCLRGALGSPGRWPAAIALLESGRVAVEALVTHELPLRDFERAFALVRARACVKLLMVPGAPREEGGGGGGQ